MRSLPKLWSKIEVDWSPSNIETVALRVQECLKFSGTAPLSISILDFLKIKKNFPYTIYTDIADHTDRWISLTVNAELFCFLVQGSSLEDIIIQRGLAQLRELVVHNWGEFPFHIFRNATALEDIGFVESNALADIHDSDHLPWTKVKRLNLQHCDLMSDRIPLIISALPSLEVLTLENGDFYMFGSSHVPSVLTLPSLHTLKVQSFFVSEFPGNWTICAPSLMNIQISDYIREEHVIWSMINTSASSIKQLHLDSCSEDFFIEVADILHSVEELSFVDADSLWDAVLLPLIWKSDGLSATENLLPSLQQLKFRGDLEEEEFMPSLIAVMHSRGAVNFSSYR
ncbi:hypothetical protein BDQ17DRAFT_1541531 [Cyathus striatus]|nr:hypothetical protein BDQ17DRAFT_1541531 [Cyathus striatus]